jgi:hypothetical protein
MRAKKLDHLLQVKISAVSKRKLDEASERTGINRAELARMSLRWALPKLLSKLPMAEVGNE